MFFDIYVALCNERNVAPTSVLTELGISKGAYSNWKIGGEPARRTQKQIADYFGLTVEEMMSGEKKKGPVFDDEANEIMREMYERPELRVLFKTSKKAKPEDVLAVDKLLRHFAGLDDE